MDFSTGIGHLIETPVVEVPTLKGRENYLWLSVGALLILCFILVVITPAVFAQSRSSDHEEYLKKIGEALRYIEENFVEEIDSYELFEGALEGMFEVLGDPYSYYLDVNAMESLSDRTEGEFGGIGIVISKETRGEDPEDKPLYIKVISPIENTPAYRAGIRAGDLIVSIGNESTEDLSIDEVVDRLRGEPGTMVRFTVMRVPDNSFEVVIARDIIEVPTVKHGMIDNDIAYLRIVEFTPFTDDRILDALEDFESAGYDSLVVDLRNNPGGLLKSVVDIADFFLAGDTIVSTRSRIPAENKIFTAKSVIEIPLEYPITILINKGSASAAEILAGALRDNGRAILVGETTFGKGSVQDVRSFGKDGFRLTTSRYYTPSGVNIDNIGIEPDVPVAEEPLNEEEISMSERLRDGFFIEDFIKKNPQPDESEIEDFLEQLFEEGISLEERILLRMIRDEINRVNNSAPIFDLEFDLVLQEAVNLIKSGQYANIATSS